MQLPAFTYHAPSSLSELVSLKKSYGQAAAVLAGGTDLVVRLKQRLVRPEAVLSTRNIAEMKGITADPIHVVIGAGVTLAGLLADETVKSEFPGLIEAVTGIGHSSCQHHTATLGGNLLLEPRCLFYNQSEFWRKGRERCFKAGGQVCLALPESKECSSVSQSDGAPMIVAYSGQMKLVSAAGERIIPAGQIYTGKGETPFSLAPEEVVTEILLPRPAGRTGSAYEKLAFRSSMDFPLVSAAAVVGVGKNKVERVRLVIGGVGPAPLPVPEADQFLRGKEPSADLIHEAGAAAAGSAAGRITGNTWSSAEYRRRMVAVVARRALSRAFERAMANPPDVTARSA